MPQTIPFFHICITLFHKNGLQCHPSSNQNTNASTKSKVYSHPRSQKSTPTRRRTRRSTRPNSPTCTRGSDPIRQIRCVDVTSKGECGGIWDCCSGGNFIFSGGDGLDVAWGCVEFCWGNGDFLVILELAMQSGKVPSRRRRRRIGGRYRLGQRHRLNFPG